MVEHSPQILASQEKVTTNDLCLAPKIYKTFTLNELIFSGFVSVEDQDESVSPRYPWIRYPWSILVTRAT